MLAGWSWRRFASCCWAVAGLGWCMLSAASAAAAQADYVWLESEQPTRANVEVNTDEWAGDARLSGRKWLKVARDAEEIAQKWPRDGGLLEYDFSIERSGAYEVWNRVGLESVRSPFEWRVDQGAWRTIAPEMLTCDLVEMGFWCEVAWIKLGEVTLDAGRHTLQIRPLPSFKEEKTREAGPDGKDREVVMRRPEKILYVSDCLCVSAGPFRPNGAFKPDADWQTDEDRQAAANVFAISDDAASAERIETPLAGLWQVCRFDEQEVTDRTGPTKVLPDADNARWMAIAVPGNKFEVKPQLRFCHRLVYRARVKAPAELAGRSFILRLPSQSLIASVHVNGQFLGWTKAPFAQWDCDVTRAMRPGEINEICVVIKDTYYAFSEKKSGKSCRASFNVPVEWMGTKSWVTQFYDFPIAQQIYGQAAGLLETPSLIAAGNVYAADVFARPAVREKQLGLELTLANPWPEARTVRVTNRIVPVAYAGPAAGGFTPHGEPEKTFATREITVPAQSQRTVQLAEAWENPRLWWPDDPALYQIVTTVEADGRAADVCRTTFGFRQWEWDGPQFRLNGVPWQLWADITAAGGDDDPEAAIARWRADGQNMWRFWGQRFGGLDKGPALDLMDARGIIVRRSGIFDGMGAQYLHQLANGSELFDNWIDQLSAEVRQLRNHPSVLIWSIENEITFINSRNLGLAQRVEPEIARGARAILALDPTRPVMVDGGNCLMDESLPVNGVHYQEPCWRDYPDEAYTLEKAYAAHEKGGLAWASGGKIPWRLVPDRPIFMGESFFVRGNSPAAYSQMAGEACFAGWGPATRRGAGLIAKMIAEGHRWHGVAAHHFWLDSSDVDGMHFNSWKPVCVFCRQWNWTFGGGAQVPRTLMVLNDTHFADPIQMAWELRVEGRSAAGQQQTFALAPGQHQQTEITLAVSRVERRTAAEFILTCSRGGREVFREVKPVAILPPDAAPKPSLAAAELAVIDPHGTAKARLHSRGIAFTEVGGVADVPAQARVVLVGKDALSARDATDPRWLALAARGARVLVLEQTQPLHFQALPADLTPTDFVGRVAFMENTDHPLFAGLNQADFFTWSGDHVVYRNPYKKATQGAISLAHCDEMLGCSAIAECPVNQGLLVLCQMVVGDKLATDPVAQRLFDNLLLYGEQYQLEQRATAVAMPADSPALKLLADSGLKFTAVDDPLAALTDGAYQIVIFAATPQNVKTLADAADRVRAFAARGGWLMAWNVGPDAIADFARLVGVDHVLRPFELERVTLATLRDPLAAGLTVRDVTLESAEKIFPWAGDKYLVDDEFSYVVDLDDIGPFCEIPGSRAGDAAAARAANAGWPRNMVNGFTSADGWKLIHYVECANPSRTFKLPREEEIRGISIVLNTHYAKASKVELFYDDDPQPVVLSTKADNSREDFELTPRKARRLTLKLGGFDLVQKISGIDNVWIRVTRSAEWHDKVKPLLNLGGLVKYPQGKGGVVLNQLLIKPSEAVSVNAQKKQTIVATLLRNLHATFAGGRVLTTANLRFHPLPLEEQCNQYLTADRGWFDAKLDLSHLPVGNQDFAGVAYAIRDFRTSPSPSCVMLAGPGARGQLPQAVTGLRVGRSADVLFFLHAFNRTAQWRRNRPTDEPPVVFRYIVHYADGQRAEIPVVYGESVDHWLSADPAGLKNASLAWAAPFPGRQIPEQAVVYQLAWHNPRPEAPIATVDLEYADQGSRYGTPALLALTAANTSD